MTGHHRFEDDQICRSALVVCSLWALRSHSPPEQSGGVNLRREFADRFGLKTLLLLALGTALLVSGVMAKASTGSNFSVTVGLVCVGFVVIFAVVLIVFARRD
jgi:hypothetical protein